MAFRIVPLEITFKNECPPPVPQWTYLKQEFGGRGNIKAFLGVKMGKSEAKPKETAKS